MSICVPCNKLKTISKCTDSIVIGTMPLPNTQYAVYIQNIATGKIVWFNGTSDGSSILTITPPDGFVLAVEQDYEIWVTAINDSVEARIDFEPEGFTVYMAAMNCALISFVQVYDGMSLYNFNYVSQTLELA